nr:hypothetical protein [Bacteroides faecichinchillae]
MIEDNCPKDFNSPNLNVNNNLLFEQTLFAALAEERGKQVPHCSTMLCQTMATIMTVSAISTDLTKSHSCIFSEVTSETSGHVNYSAEHYLIAILSTTDELWNSSHKITNVLVV